MEKMKPLPLGDKLKSIPGLFGIHLEESPAYEVLETLDKIEVRQYPQTLRAEVALQGEYEEVKNANFTKLANYIFGENSVGIKMEMTTPVLIGKHPRGWSMSFFIPAKNAGGPPQPIDSLVRVSSYGIKTYAALTYSGNVTEQRMLEKEQELLLRLAQTGFKALGSPFTAQYDQPFAVPFLKKNEALVEVVRSH